MNNDIRSQRRGGGGIQNREVAAGARRDGGHGLKWLLPLLVCGTLPTLVVGLGGEKASFDTPQFAPDISYRQDVCDRYDDYRFNGSNLKSALNGMQLNVIVGNYQGTYFNYNEETGINSDYPGLMAVILDELAEKAGFTWRESFGLFTDPVDSNKTWTEMLFWTVESYDVSIDWWSQNLQRMNGGAAFVKEWLDSSLILVTNKEQGLGSVEINPWNWTKPFDGGVWLMTLFTVVVSGLVYQILEWYADEREDRTAWEWWLENFYMSALNFTQAYEYEPKTLASRIFGLSMAMWGLLMTATYTANLASLLVGQRIPQPGPQTMQQVEFFGYSVCVWEGTYSDDYLQEEYPDAKRVPKATLPQLYEGLRDGECDYLMTSVASWERLKGVRDFNPECDLYWVAGDRKVKNFASGFATKADSGDLCTGFIRDVLNVHMHDIIDSGFLEEAWQREYQQAKTIDCDNYKPDPSSDEGEGSRNRRRRLLETPGGYPMMNSGGHHRILRRGGGGGASAGAIASASANGGGEDAQELTPAQMIGTFTFHWGLMALSLIVAAFNSMYNKFKKRQKGEPYIQGKEMAASTTTAPRGLDSSMMHSVITGRNSLDASSLHRSSRTIQHVNTTKVDMTSSSTGTPDGSENSTARMETQILLKQLAVMQQNEHEFRQAMMTEQQQLRQQNQDLQSQMELLVMYFSSQESGHRNRQSSPKAFASPSPTFASSSPDHLPDVFLNEIGTSTEKNSIFNSVGKPGQDSNSVQDGNTVSTSGASLEPLDFNS